MIIDPSNYFVGNIKTEAISMLRSGNIKGALEFTVPDLAEVDEGYFFSLDSKRHITKILMEMYPKEVEYPGRGYTRFYFKTKEDAVEAWVAAGTKTINKFQKDNKNRIVGKNGGPDLVSASGRNRFFIEALKLECADLTVEEDDFYFHLTSKRCQELFAKKNKRTVGVRPPTKNELFSYRNQESLLSFIGHITDDPNMGGNPLARAKDNLEHFEGRLKDLMNQVAFLKETVQDYKLEVEVRTQERSKFLDSNPSELDIAIFERDNDKVYKHIIDSVLQDPELYAGYEDALGDFARNLLKN